MTRFRRTAACSIMFLMLAAVVGACADDSPDAASGGDAGMDRSADMKEQVEQLGAPQPAAVAYDEGTTATTGGTVLSASTGRGGGGLGESFGESPSVGPSVIKTAHIDLEVAKDGLQEATRSSISIASRFGGFVLATATNDDRKASATVTLRIPADSFERALAELEGLGDVKGEQISGEDVGQEFVDLAARVRNLESQETVLLRLMDRSVSVADTIRVQRELQGVQLEIERLTGRLRYLKDQADMGTISLAFVEVGAPAAPRPARVIARAWAQAIDLSLGVVAAVIVGTGFLIPVAVLAAIAFLALRALRPRLNP